LNLEEWFVRNVSFVLCISLSCFNYILLIGEKKLGTLACPEKWKEGSRSTIGMLIFFR